MARQKKVGSERFPRWRLPLPDNVRWEIEGLAKATGRDPGAIVVELALAGMMVQSGSNPDPTWIQKPPNRIQSGSNMDPETPGTGGAVSWLDDQSKIALPALPTGTSKQSKQQARDVAGARVAEAVPPKPAGAGVRGLLSCLETPDSRVTERAVREASEYGERAVAAAVAVVKDRRREGSIGNPLGLALHLLRTEARGADLVGSLADKAQELRGLEAQGRRGELEPAATATGGWLS